MRGARPGSAARRDQGHGREADAVEQREDRVVLVVEPGQPVRAIALVGGPDLVDPVKERELAQRVRDRPVGLGRGGPLYPAADDPAHRAVGEVGVLRRGWLVVDLHLVLGRAIRRRFEIANAFGRGRRRLWRLRLGRRRGRRRSGAAPAPRRLRPAGSRAWIRAARGRGRRARSWAARCCSAHSSPTSGSG